MGKLADPSIRLQCVHCHNTETPLWRAGPDGPKTLCNACGVRYKKGKLVLYKDDLGNLTAIKRSDALPFHVPPSSKKLSKRVPSPSSQPSSPDLSAKRSAIRKIPSESALHPTFGKKPRSRSRRTNAGQLPGRYATKTLPESISISRSPASSPRISPSPPAASVKPRAPTQNRKLSNVTNKTKKQPKNIFIFLFCEQNQMLTNLLCTCCYCTIRYSHVYLFRSCLENRLAPLNMQNLLTVNEPPLSKFIDPQDETMFPDMAVLGLNGSPRASNNVILAMPVDASSVEQFSFAFSGQSNSFNIDAPDRREALRGLVQDGTTNVSRAYEATVTALSWVCEQRHMRAKARKIDAKLSSVDDCRNFVRAFAHEQSSGFGMEDCHSSPTVFHASASPLHRNVGVMLPEKAAHCNAAECFNALMDSSELQGFAEACMVELLAEDVIAALAQHGLADFEKDAACRIPDATMRSKAIPTTA